AHRIPEALTLAQAALVEPMAVVLKGLRRLEGAGGAQANAPRECAVIGGGTIGHLAARVLASRGHRVTVFDREPARLARLNGAAQTETALGGLDRFAWVVEATGDQTVLSTLLQESATGACLLLLGLPYGTHPFSFESIVGFDRVVVGSVGSTGADFEEALRVLPGFVMEAFLEARYPLRDYRRAWDALRSRAHLKVMLQVDAAAT
ncbi:MAG TPA: zinc-binding dehydrogenase, partial [Gemmatimonadales bacterium]|nr:zinc-binding dehydrogenase [Gemmatimonadales bacterium]